MMRIAHVSGADGRGGAELFARRLGQSLRTRGHSSWLLVGKRLGEDPDSIEIPNPRVHNAWYRALDAVKRTLPTGPGFVWLQRLLSLLRDPVTCSALLAGREPMFSPATRRLLSLTPAAPELLHCHNMHGYDGYFDLTALPSLCRQAPVLMTLHDAWLLSGHCSYSYDCLRWKSGCGACPDLESYYPLWRDGTAWNWRRKAEAFSRSRVWLAAPSQWLLDCAGNSMLQPAVVEAKLIPNGVDLGRFRPGDRHRARNMLGLPCDEPIVLLVASAVRSDSRKGIKMARETLERISASLPQRQVLFVAVGEAGPSERVGSSELRYAGYEPDPSRVAAYYQSADVFLAATRGDNFPTTVLESLACGTPVVATSVGGVPEQIEEGRTGFLVGAGDAAAMAGRTVLLLAEPRLREKVSEAARKSAVERFGWSEMVTRYLEWYEVILESWRADHGTEKHG